GLADYGQLFSHHADTSPSQIACIAGTLISMVSLSHAAGQGGRGRGRLGGRGGSREWERETDSSSDSEMEGERERESSSDRTMTQCRDFTLILSALLLSSAVSPPSDPTTSTPSSRGARGGGRLPTTPTPAGANGDMSPSAPPRVSPVDWITTAGLLARILFFLGEYRMCTDLLCAINARAAAHGSLGPLNALNGSYMNLVVTECSLLRKRGSREPLAALGRIVVPLRQGLALLPSAQAGLLCSYVLNLGLRVSGTTGGAKECVSEVPLSHSDTQSILSLMGLILSTLDREDALSLVGDDAETHLSSQALDVLGGLCTHTPHRTPPSPSPSLPMSVLPLVKASRLLSTAASTRRLALKPRVYIPIVLSLLCPSSPPVSTSLVSVVPLVCRFKPAEQVVLLSATVRALSLSLPVSRPIAARERAVYGDCVSLAADAILALPPSVPPLLSEVEALVVRDGTSASLADGAEEEGPSEHNTPAYLAAVSAALPLVQCVYGAGTHMPTQPLAALFRALATHTLARQRKYALAVPSLVSLVELVTGQTLTGGEAEGDGESDADMAQPPSPLVGLAVCTALLDCTWPASEAAVAAHLSKNRGRDRERERELRKEVGEDAKAVLEQERQVERRTLPAIAMSLTLLKCLEGVTEEERERETLAEEEAGPDAGAGCTSAAAVSTHQERVAKMEGYVGEW
ncbi:hypothetical protein KIPB_008653, partial [Kipferlia bialata]